MLFCVYVLTLVALVMGAPLDPFNFPPDVGHQGPYNTGQPAFLAQTDPVAAATGTPTSSYTLAQPIETGVDVSLGGSGKDSIFHYMGTYSPYHVPEGWGVYDYRLPQQCKITNVHSLLRHGARYDVRGSNLATFLSNTEFNVSGELEFLKDWKENTGRGQLTTAGRLEMFSNGATSNIRYGSLWNPSNKLVVRTTSKQRIHESTKNFLAGFFGLNWQNYANVELIVEDPQWNSTLTPNNACPNSVKPIDEIDAKVHDFKHKYLKKAKKRFNKSFQGRDKKSGNATEIPIKAVRSMQRLCAFETVIYGYSQFCTLFTIEEFQDYALGRDYAYYYENSYGNPTSKARGIGWLNEFHRRLTGAPYDPSKQATENRTLDSSDITFPTNQTLYFDFAHDTGMINVLTALDVKWLKTAFSVSEKGKNITRSHNNFLVSDLVPFGAHFDFEIIECASPVPADRSAESTGENKVVRYIHGSANDRTLPLDQRAFDICESRVDGWCELDKFVQHLDVLPKSVNFTQACYGNQKMVPVTDGVPQ